MVSPFCNPEIDHWGDRRGKEYGSPVVRGDVQGQSRRSGALIARDRMRPKCHWKLMAVGEEKYSMDFCVCLAQ